MGLLLSKSSVAEWGLIPLVPQPHSHWLNHPHLAGAQQEFTCSLLARERQVIVAGDVVPFALLMPDHHNAVLARGEEVVRLVGPPVLKLLGGRKTLEPESPLSFPPLCLLLPPPARDHSYLHCYCSHTPMAMVPRSSASGQAWFHQSWLKPGKTIQLRAAFTPYPSTQRVTRGLCPQHHSSHQEHQFPRPRLRTRSVPVAHQRVPIRPAEIVLHSSVTEADPLIVLCMAWESRTEIEGLVLAHHAVCRHPFSSSPLLDLGPWGHLALAFHIILHKPLHHKHGVQWTDPSLFSCPSGSPNTHCSQILVPLE